MKIKVFSIIVLVSAVLAISLVGLVLTGCTSTGATAADVQPVNVSINGQQGIWVNGQGTVTVTPDIAIVNLGVSARSSTVADAQS